ncbi:MAG: hypothetical protein ACJA2S_004603 [Cyclobacteriaceae bacterium]|jgi:hypothetical protein
MKLERLLLFTLLISCTSTTNSEYIINEEFNENQLGWVEEWSEAHHTEITEGKLLLKSLDTAANYSSNGPRNNNAMWTLPTNWQFSTSMEVIDGGTEAGFGFILFSASLNYEFGINRSGKVYISEYDYNKQAERPIVDEIFEDLTLDYNTPTNLMLEVKGTSFEFYVNNQKVGKGSFSAKSWETLRLFAKAGGTGIKVDYYRIKSL